VRDGVLDGGVGIQGHVVGRVVDQPDRQRHLQLAAPGFGELTTAEASSDEMQFGFRHGALETQQEPVVEIGRVVESVLVTDQRVRQPADLQEAMPVGVVAGQPGHLQAQHDPGSSHPHLCD
jgi:hypothetical protein